jgi:hypothetical protein
MALVLLNQGEVIMLEALVNKTAPQNLKLRVYKSNTTPAKTDTEATYTEADFTGYAAIAFVAANWVTTPGGLLVPSEIAYALQTFLSSAGSQNQNVYGYYVTQAVSGKAVWAERFSDGPYNIANLADAIDVTPPFTQA